MAPLRLILYAFTIVTSVYSTRLHGITTDASLFVANTYDFLIIGGGTSGLTIASRISENPKVTVGIIEAGQFHPNEDLINVPFLFGHALGNASLDWNFATVPQQNLDQRVIPTPRGKTLGGSSAINFMVFGRGSKAEYDAWASLGNPGWDWNGLLPYFKKSETVTPGQSGVIPGVFSQPGSDNSVEGRKGPLQIGFNTNATFVLPDIVAPYVQSFERIGSFANANPDAGNATGIFQSARSVDPAKNSRSYATTAYLTPNQARPNLLVLTGAEATRIIFAKRAEKYVSAAVEFSSNGKILRASVNTEVILAAGSINTPKLLELSGIGGKALLNRLEIPLLIDLPGVGENLQDHMLIGSDFLLKDPAPLTWDIVRNNSTFNVEQLEQYSKSHDGIYAATSAVFVFHALQSILSPSEFQQILSQLDSDIAHGNFTPFQQAQYKLQRELLVDGRVGQLEFGMVPSGASVATNIPPLEGRSYISIVALSSRPFSRGTVHINSSNPLVPPLIDPKYLEVDFDLRLLTSGTKLIRNISQTEPLASLIEAPSTPSASVMSPEDFESFVRTFSGSVFHPAGTAAMAPRAIGGVVDTDLLVYGTANLRIVDASIIPLIIAAHLQATVYAIAEKGADIIKANYA